jgi:hypothetical protein
MGLYYLEFWPSAAAALCLALLGATGMPARARTWSLVTIGVISAALTLYIPPLLERASDPVHNMLVRDILASVAIASAAPAFGAWVSFSLQSRRGRPVVRALSSLGVSILVLAAAPVVLLFAHCTSGDCL